MNLFFFLFLKQNLSLNVCVLIFKHSFTFLKKKNSQNDFKSIEGVLSPHPFSFSILLIQIFTKLSVVFEAAIWARSNH